jgi:hypothetical protein
MTKELYIAHFEAQNGEEILYQFYLERFDSTKHKPLLDKVDFLHKLKLLMDIRGCFEMAFNYYNNKFDIIVVTDKDKTFLK